jgi:hypothetical protein
MVGVRILGYRGGMTDEPGRTDEREDVPGPEGSKLAPEGNTKARLFIPEDQEPADDPEGGEGEGSEETDEDSEDAGDGDE